MRYSECVAYGISEFIWVIEKGNTDSEVGTNVLPKANSIWICETVWHVQKCVLLSLRAYFHSIWITSKQLSLSQRHSQTSSYTSPPAWTKPQLPKHWELHAPDLLHLLATPNLQINQWFAWNGKYTAYINDFCFTFEHCSSQRRLTAVIEGVWISSVLD